MKVAMAALRKSHSETTSARLEKAMILYVVVSFWLLLAVVMGTLVLKESWGRLW